MFELTLVTISLTAFDLCVCCVLRAVCLKIDVDEMSGSTLEAMAEAVEVICASFNTLAF